MHFTTASSGQSNEKEEVPKLSLPTHNQNLTKLLPIFPSNDVFILLKH